MGGAAGEGNRTPAAEFNIWCDPEAAHRVFESGIQLTMVGLDVTHQALVSDAERDRLRALGRVGQLAAELLDFYGRFHRRAYPELAGSPMHDPVAVAQVIWPDLSSYAPPHVEVDCGWEQGRGRTNVDWLRVDRGLAPNAEVGVRLDPQRFLALLGERLASLG